MVMEAYDRALKFGRNKKLHGDGGIRQSIEIWQKKTYSKQVQEGISYAFIFKTGIGRDAQDEIKRACDRENKKQKDLSLIHI